MEVKKPSHQFIALSWLLAGSALLLGCSDDVPNTSTEGTETDSTTKATSEDVTSGTPPTSDPTADPTEDPTGGPEPVCGNGTKEGVEECDNGADNADDKACTGECKVNVCGCLLYTSPSPRD